MPTWGPLTGLVVSGPLDNREWETLGGEMGKDILVVIICFPGRKTIKNSLSLPDLPFWTYADVHIGKPPDFQENFHVLPTIWIFSCDNPPNYLLGIFIQYGKNFLRKQPEPPMESIARCFASSVLFSNLSMIPMGLSWITAHFLFFGLKLKKYCPSVVKFQ